MMELPISKTFGCGPFLTWWVTLTGALGGKFGRGYPGNKVWLWTRKGSRVAVAPGPAQTSEGGLVVEMSDCFGWLPERETVTTIVQDPEGILTQFDSGFVD